MKRLSVILVVLSMLAVLPAISQAAVTLGTEDPSTGLTVQFHASALYSNGTTYSIYMSVASDGEDYFDPFNFGGDTSDGISFFPLPASGDGNWLTGANTGNRYRTQLLGFFLQPPWAEKMSRHSSR